MDSFCESMDSFCIVVTNPDSKKIRFVSWLTNPTSQICKSGFASPILKDSNGGFVSWPELTKTRPVFTNPTNPHEAWWILSTIAQNESLQIQAGKFADLICRAFFKRFVSWILFVRSKIPNYSMRFGRIRIRIPHPYVSVIIIIIISIGNYYEFLSGACSVGWLFV